MYLYFESLFYILTYTVLVLVSTQGIWSLPCCYSFNIQLHNLAYTLANSSKIISKDFSNLRHVVARMNSKFSKVPVYVSKLHYNLVITL